MGRWLRTAGYIPDRVVCSTAPRARQTWELVQPALGADPRITFDHRVYESSAVQLRDLIRGLPFGGRTLLIVGHDPAIPELARGLAEANPADTATAAALKRLRTKFPTGAVAVFRFGEDWDQFARNGARQVRFVTPWELPAPPSR